MSQLSRLSRLRKHRERTLTQAHRRRQLVAGFEPLEDRRMMAISTSFNVGTGVLTFTGDQPGAPVNDKVVIESTATPGTINYDAGQGLGSTTQAGVNSVVFNAGAGVNEMIIINQAPSVLRPFAGGFFDVFFNVDLDGISDDRLRMAGGSAATITGASYTVSTANSGIISYTTGFTPININFSGMDANGVDEIDDETIQAGVFTTNSSTAAENITVKVGPTLIPVQTFTQGPVFIDGGDRDDHGSAPGGVNINGWKFIQQAVQFVRTGSFNTGTIKDVLIIGANGSTASAAIGSALSVFGYTSDTVTAVGGGALQIGGVNFNNYKLIYVPSNEESPFNNTPGGITNPQLAALNARKADVQAFVRAGGGIVALTEQDSVGAYGWLELPLPFVTFSNFETVMVQDPNLAAAGFSISNTELSAGTPSHNGFSGPPGFNGLDVFVRDDDGQVVTLGQGAINQTVGGGPTTQISGNMMTLINLGNKPSLALNGLGGTDNISVDGSVLSLDGLLAPVAINGGSNGDSLSITDSADNTGVGDAVSVTSLATSGLAAFPITYSGIGSLSVQATQGADNMTVDLSPAAPGLTSVTVLGGLSGDLFTGPSGYIRPSGTIALNVHGGTAAASPAPGLPFNPVGEPGDKFNLDMTTRADGSSVTPVVIVDTNGGNAISSNTQLVRFTGIEDIDLLDGGLLTNTAIGDFYLRGTDQADYIQFVSNGLADPAFRVRFGNVYYPATGSFGPYSTGGATPSKIYVYGRGGNDTINMYNTRLNAVFFGEAGDDILTGGYGNDLLIGGSGNDRINGGVVGGNDEIWGDDFDPIVDGASLATRSIASQTGTGNDQINTFGGEDTVYGQGGADIINSGNGADYLNGGPGDDQLDGQGGNDRIYGGGGVDVLSGSDGNDVVAGNAGNDTVYGRLGNDILIGGLDQDIVNGNEGGDALIGDESNGAGSGSLAKGDAADAALLALLTLWGPTPTLASLGAFNSAGADGSVDTLWGGADADAFYGFGALLDLAADRNAPGYGPDLN